MSEAFFFAFGAFLFLLSILFFLMRALLKPTSISFTDENLRILKNQLKELEKARQQNFLTEAEFLSQKEDLEKRVLEENSQKNEGLPWKTSPQTAWFLVLCISLCSIALYALWGNPNAMQRAVRDPIFAMEETLFQNYSAESPDSLNRILNFSMELQNAGQKERALLVLEKLEKLNPQNPDFLSLYASALWGKTGTFNGKAWSLLHTALSLNENHPQTLFFLGYAFLEKGDFTKAKDFFIKAQNQNSDPRVLLMIKEALLAVESRLNPQSEEAAIAQIKELKNQLSAQFNAPTFKEKGAPVWWILAKAAHNLKEYALALAMFKEGKDFFPENNAELLALYAGSLWRENEDKNEARALLEKAKAIHPQNEWVIFYSAFFEENLLKRESLLKSLKLDEKSLPHLKNEVQLLENSFKNPR